MNAAECRRVYEMASIVECVASDKAGVTLRADATTTHREHPRITTWLDAVWHQKETRASVGLLDLSAGGCFIRSLDPSPPTGEFRLRLSLPDGTSLWVTVGVVYARPSRGYGLEFVNLTPPLQAVLARFIDQLAESTS